MDVPLRVFDWLKATEVFQDVHAAKKKKGSVSLTPEAARALLSGHIAYYAARNALAQRGVNVTQTIAGNPGDVVAAEMAHYNWSTVCEMLGKLNINLTPDHRMLLGCGDPGIIVDLMSTMAGRLTKPQRAARSPSPARHGVDPTNRTGAVSVDQGKQRLKGKRRDSDERFDVFKDLERIRKKREEKLNKAKEELEKQKETEARMKAMRDKLTAIGDAKKGLLSETDVTSAPLPCYLLFTNRGNVQFCHQLVCSVVNGVLSGEGQEVIRQKEAERKKAKELAARRKAEGDRFVPLGKVTVPKESDHRSVVLCKDIVYEMIVRASLPETKLDLEKKDKERMVAAEAIKQKINKLYGMRTHGRKFDAQRKEDDERKQRLREERERRYQEMRKENEERARSDADEQRGLRREKELASKLKEEELKRKEAERMLYYAEQKARVLEARRANAVEEELRRAKEAEEDREMREKRRQRTIEVSRKLMEKELQREAAAQGAAAAAPTSLSPFSVGTGQRSGYTGSSLGWQFLTDDERHMAELLHTVRSDPEEGIGIVESRIANTKGSVVWFNDQGGRRHPLTLAEGPDVHGNALEALSRLSRRANAVLSSCSFHVNMSIALTLAARCHAADLAFHGVADPSVWHIGSDGGSATQRVGRFGTGLGGPGTTQEVVVSVVRPADVKLSPSDMLGFALVDDGCPSRENREGVLKSVAATSGAGTECCGVGHAVTMCGDDTAVEVFVILFTAGTYTDKSVAQMATAQYNCLQATAQPFLEGQRVVTKSVAASKKDLYKVTNVTIGRKTEGLKPSQLERLSHKKKLVPQPSMEAEAADAAQLREPAQPSLRRKRSSRVNTLVEMAAGDEDEPFAHRDSSAANADARANHIDDDASRGETPAPLNKRRLSSFFQRYAPEKVAVVDTALALNKGREDEMFQKLTEKYGPEPPTSPPRSPSDDDAYEMSGEGGLVEGEGRGLVEGSGAALEGGGGHTPLDTEEDDADGQEETPAPPPLRPIAIAQQQQAAQDASVSLPTMSHEGDPLASFTLHSPAR